MTGLAAAGPRWNASCCDSIVVRFTVTFAAVGNESWRLLEALRPFTAATHPGHGCLAWALTVSSDAGHASCLRYREDWSSEVELRDRVRSDRFPRLLAVMEAALIRPRIEFELPTGSRGLEYVEELRQAP